MIEQILTKNAMTSAGQPILGPMNATHVQRIATIAQATIIQIMIAPTDANGKHIFRTPLFSDHE
jgi:hypothetical protein